MSFYEKYCLPGFLNCLCGLKAIGHQREKIVPLAKGKVLEIGMGTGLNIPYYDESQVDMVWGLEPSEAMREKARSRVEKAPFEIRWLDLPSESIPLEDNSVDCVLLTYTLCTISDWHKALLEMRRVLKPKGSLIFCEHGQAPDENTRKWQARINPMWKKIAGGCNLNRPIPEFIENAGFQIQEIKSKYIAAPKIASYNYWGIAE